MHPTAANFGADHRRGDHLALAFFKQQNGHALADVFTRDIFEDASAFGVQSEVHRGFLGLVVKAGLRVCEVFTGQQHLLFHHHGLAIAFQVFLGAKRHHATAHLGQTGITAVVDHADFKRRRAAQDVFGFGGVLHAGQLHHDAVQALLLNDRFGHTELVDPVV